MAKVQLEPSFHLNIDEPQGLLVATFIGFWTLETVIEFETARRTAVAQLTRSLRPGQTAHYLVDRSRQPAQSQEVVAALSAIFSQSGFPGRKAVIISGALLRRQAERVNEGAETRFFGDRMAALAWLRSG